MADHSFQFEMSVQSIFLTIKVWRNQKGLSEAASRRSDNTKVKKNKANRQTTIYKTLHRKLKIEQHDSH